jgi:hypothetical protein
LDGNLLNATKANLQAVSRSDMAFLGKTRPADKLLGVQYAVPPRWLKTPFHYHSRIQIEGKHLHLGSFLTAEEAASAYDGAARRLYGSQAVTNRSLGLISEKRARTKLLRTAARKGKGKVAQRLDEIMLAKSAAFDADPSLANFMAMATRRERQTRVILASFAKAGQKELAGHL